MVCEMLIKLIRGDLIEEAQILIKPSLVVRQSSGSQITS
jgi:DNA-binding LacI/PurR family transcriptional regulator